MKMKPGKVTFLIKVNTNVLNKIYKIKLKKNENF